jgi:hypothetical protein
LNENGRTPSSRRRSNDSEAPMRWPSGVVERERHAQALRPVAQGGELPSTGVSAAGSELPSSSAQAPRRSLATCSLRAALLVEVALDDPAGHQREQQQHHHDGGVDPQIEALHRRPARAAAGVMRQASSASCLRANT